jgi:pimeloyl-ACP methyl ester carboxylesterase
VECEPLFRAAALRSGDACRTEVDVTAIVIYILSFNSLGRCFDMDVPRKSEDKWNAICLHGALQCRDIFNPLIDYFKKHHSDSFGEAVAIDLPGHGEATGSRVRFEPDILARFVLDAVPEMIFDRPTIIVAQSFSGVSAMKIQQMRAEISGVVMLDTPLHNISARDSIQILVQKYKKDRENNVWIVDFLKDFFGFTLDHGFAASIDYHDYIVESDIPVLMITGSEKKTLVVLEGDGSGNGPDSKPRLLSGTFEQLTCLGRRYPGRVRLYRSAAIFGDRDVRILAQKNAINFEVHEIAGQGHNILTATLAPVIGSVINKFAAKCVKLTPGKESS